MKSEDIMAVIENREQAQAFADFLRGEWGRHTEDIIQIERDLKALEKQWGVTPEDVRQVVG